MMMVGLAGGGGAAGEWMLFTTTPPPPPPLHALTNTILSRTVGLQQPQHMHNNTDTNTGMPMTTTQYQTLYEQEQLEQGKSHPSQLYNPLYSHLWLQA